MLKFYIIQQRLALSLCCSLGFTSGVKQIYFDSGEQEEHQLTVCHAGASTYKQQNGSFFPVVMCAAILDELIPSGRENLYVDVCF